MGAAVLRSSLFSLASLLLLLIGGAPQPALADDDRHLAGTLEAELDGRKVQFPSLKVDVQADVDGDLATVTVVQTFVNPLDRPIHATYLFPLNERAAVYEMTMEVGDERVRAVIKERAEAEKTFEAAKDAGKAASLLTEERPNMFTQKIANLMPGLPIRVELKYVHTVERRDGEYHLVVPLVVGPRFNPPGPKTIPDQPPVAGIDIPPTVEQDRVALNVRLKGGMSVSGISSKTHAIEVKKHFGSEKDDFDVRVAGGRIIDNKDFVLKYRLGGERTTAGLLAYRDERGGFFSLLIEPPPVPAADEITAREMVFLLDCSGSMSGLPMDASKAFMRRALKGLRPTDSFRIIRFSDGASEFTKEPQAATPENVERGVLYVDQLAGEGGTMMTAGIRQALETPVPAGSIRIVTFLTDGYIGNEYEVLALVKQLLGDARLFALGVGSGVNRFLLEKLGKMGRGFTRYMNLKESVDDVAGELAARLDAPVLTDIAIDWGGLAPDSLTPERVPDLFAGDTVRVQGHFDKPGTYTIKVNGRIGGKNAVLPLKVVLPESSSSGEGVALVWARATIDEMMDTLVTPEPARDPRLADDDIRQLVTELGLEFGLLTRWTSFVAVSERIVNDAPDGTPTLPVPLHKVDGVSDRAYAKDKVPVQQAAAPTVGTAGGFLLAFAGESAPEPSVIGGWVVLAAAAALAATQRGARATQSRGKTSKGGTHVG